MHIVIGGGTGFLGAALVARLREQGDAVTLLTRDTSPAVDGADVVINLAGAPIAEGRWTRKRKAAIHDSRIQVTRALVTAIHTARRKPSVLISGSAIGIYGPRGDEPVTEDAPPGSDFLARVCVDWEREARAAETMTRVVLLRTGVVLHGSGGALPRIAMPFRIFAGGPLGSGRQYMSWIHRDDWVEMVRWAMATASVSGALNVTTPTPATNREFAQALGRALRRPAIMPVPAIALRLALGEMSDVLLTGQRVMPAKAQSLGFDFRYPRLEDALRAALT